MDQPAPAPAPPPPVDGGGLILGPANITIVKTAAQLKQAVVGRAQDIEIREHLDLTPLLDDRGPFLDTPAEKIYREALIDPLALVLLEVGTRSIRGNCSDPDAAAALELPRPGPRDAPLLPLKPFQCMLLLPDTFLAVEKGRVWVDNLYLKLMPKPQQVLRHLKRTPSFITAGRRLENSVSDDYNPGSRLENPAKTNLHLTDITFQGDDTQGARGVYLSGFAAETTVYVSDCVFTDWSGRSSPLLISRLGSASITDSVFRNMNQSAEIVDVSYGGLVRFENVLFADAGLPDMHVVGTSMNDYQHAFVRGLDDIGIYYATDDENYDVTTAVLPPDRGGVFDADHIIEMAVMSDCLFMEYEENDTMPQPGCPLESVQARQSVAARMNNPNATIEVVEAAYYEPEEETGSGGSVVFGGAIPFSDFEAAPAPKPLYDYEYVNPDAERIYVETDSSHTYGDYSYGYVADGVVAYSPGSVQGMPFAGDYDLSYYGSDAAYPSAYRDAYSPYGAYVYGAGMPPEYGGGAGAPLDAYGGDASYEYPEYEPYSSFESPFAAERLEIISVPNIWFAGLQQVLPPRQPAPQDWPPFVAPDTMPGSQAPAAALVQPFTPREAISPAAAEAEDAGVPSPSTNRQLASAGIILLFVSVVIALTVYAFVVAMRRKAAKDREEKNSKAATGGMLQGGVVGGPTKEDSHARQVAKLSRQLDLFKNDDLLLEQYELLGRDKMCRGSESFVQYARGHTDGKAYAIKFFLNHSRFVAEATLLAAFQPYLRASLSHDLAVAAEAAADDAPASAPPAADFLPRAHTIGDTAKGKLTDPRGRPLPSCIVVDKGLSLHDWSDNTPPDLFTALAMLSSVSKRLAALHEAGYVHRDLKPSNVMLMTTDKRWTVVGFSRAARAGTEMPLHLTLAYAAPESVRAFASGAATMACRPSQDAWALGVMAFELLTGASAFQIVTDGQSKVIAQLKGETSLPWEGSRSSKALQKLGMLRAPVLNLLERSPTHRCTARQFHVACNKAFADHAVVDM